MTQDYSDLSNSKDRVVRNFQGLIEGTEDLLRSTAGAGGESVDAARRNLRTYLDAARGTLSDVEAMAIDRYQQVSRNTDQYVRGNPWQSVGIAAAIGVVLGLLVSRR